MITPLLAGPGRPLKAEMRRALLRAGFEVKDAAEMGVELSDQRACELAVSGSGADVIIDCTSAGQEPEGEPVALQAALAQTQNLARAAAAAGAHTVYLSSAVVFGREPDAVRVESDPPVPDSPAGAALLAAEQSVARLNEQYTILRSGSLYGPFWMPPFEDLIAQASDGDRLFVVPQPVCPPTYAPHLADVVVALIRRPCYGIVHRAATGACNELELARRVVGMVGLATQIEPPPTESVTAERDLTPVCLSSRRDELPTVPHWRIGLRVCALVRQKAIEQPPG